MTAQVVLYNKLGVALASDSAVTSNRQKVLNGSEKILDLGSDHKIAILTSGLSTFMGYPWEVIVSAWSDSLHRLATMDEYADSLFKFMRTLLPSGPVLCEEEVSFIEARLIEIIDMLKRIYSEEVVPVFSEILDSETLNTFNSSDWDLEFRQNMSDQVSVDLADAICNRLRNEIAEQREFERVKNISESQVRVWVENYWRTIERTFSEAVLTDWPEIEGVAELVDEWLESKLLYIHGAEGSDICLVGYAGDDLFPSSTFFTVTGSVGGTLLKAFDATWLPTQVAQRLFFGQSDAIRALFTEEDALLTTTAVNAQQRFINSVVEQLEKSSDENALQAKAYLEQNLASDYLGEELRRVGNQERDNPFRRAISMAPISDLAEFAAQLVGVQATYALMNQDTPTVGGPVDVATITHKDGFRWVRHKGN